MLLVAAGIAGVVYGIKRFRGTDADDLEPDDESDESEIQDGVSK